MVVILRGGSSGRKQKAPPWRVRVVAVAEVRFGSDHGAIARLRMTRFDCERSSFLYQRRAISFDSDTPRPCSKAHDGAGGGLEKEQEEQKIRLTPSRPHHTRY